MHLKKMTLFVLALNAVGAGHAMQIKPTLFLLGTEHIGRTHQGENQLDVMRRVKAPLVKRVVLEAGNQGKNFLPRLFVKSQRYTRSISIHQDSPEQVVKDLAACKKYGVRPKSLRVLSGAPDTKTFASRDFRVFLSNAWLKHLNDVSYRISEKGDSQLKGIRVLQKIPVLLGKIHCLNTNMALALKRPDNFTDPVEFLPLENSKFSMPRLKVLTLQIGHDFRKAEKNKVVPIEESVFGAVLKKAPRLEILNIEGEFNGTCYLEFFPWEDLTFLKTLSFRLYLSWEEKSQVEKFNKILKGLEKSETSLILDIGIFTPKQELRFDTRISLPHNTRKLIIHDSRQGMGARRAFSWDGAAPYLKSLSLHPPSSLRSSYGPTAIKDLGFIGWEALQEFCYDSCPTKNMSFSQEMETLAKFRAPHLKRVFLNFRHDTEANILKLFEGLTALAKKSSWKGVELVLDHKLMTSPYAKEGPEQLVEKEILKSLVQTLFKTLYHQGWSVTFVRPMFLDLFFNGSPQDLDQVLLEGAHGKWDVACLHPSAASWEPNLQLGFDARKGERKNYLVKFQPLK